MSCVLKSPARLNAERCAWEIVTDPERTEKSGGAGKAHPTAGRGESIQENLATQTKHEMGTRAQERWGTLHVTVMSEPLLLYRNHRGEFPP